MEQKTLELIEKLGTVIAQSGDVMVSEYTTWHFVSSVAFIVLGFAICAAAAALAIYAIKDGNMEPLLIIACLVFFVGCLFIFCNIPGIFAPKAEAIHQLLKDIKPR